MLPQNNPDRIRIVFDDHRLVANAGLLLPATLAQHLGLRELVDRQLDPGGTPGRANTGDKLLTLVASALAGGDCIDDADALRAGGTAGVLGCVVKAPSTLGTFLRSFRPHRTGPGWVSDQPNCLGDRSGTHLPDSPAYAGQTGSDRPDSVRRAIDPGCGTFPPAKRRSRHGAVLR